MILKNKIESDPQKYQEKAIRISTKQLNADAERCPYNAITALIIINCVQQKQ